ETLRRGEQTGNRPDGAGRKYHGACRQDKDRGMPYRLPPCCRERAVLGEPACNCGGRVVSQKAVRLKTPLGDEILAIHAGDRVELSGLVYTARDEAHLRMQKKGIPFDPK